MRALVQDVMSTRPITARRDTSVGELIRTMLASGIGGLPVVDEDGHVQGVVSRSDVLQAGEDPRRPVRTAADVMTSPVVSVAESDTVPEAARILRRHRVKRAPVLRRGRIVGIITQSDLLRPYLRADAEISAEIEELFLGAAPRERDLVVTVDDGVVLIRGCLRDPAVGLVLVMLARAVDGVIDVVDSTQPSLRSGGPAWNGSIDPASPRV